MPITTAVQDGVGTVTIARPDKLNAVDPAHLTDLRAALSACAADAAVRVIVLTGAGERAFCTGSDLSATAAQQAGVAEAFGFDLEQAVERGLYTRLFDLSTLQLRKPLIAAINGFCLGGGLELALQCELRVAADNASFGLPEVAVATLPAGGGVPLLLRAIPRAVAMRMFLSGERIDARRAYEVGLVSDLWPAAQLMERTYELARRIAGNGPLAVQMVKMLAQHADSAHPAQGMQLTELAWGLLRDTADRSEGRRAFAEKRKPDFKGR